MKKTLRRPRHLVSRIAVVLLLSIASGMCAEKMKVILDTDIGGDIDDAWALAFVIQYPEFEPLGVTICDGDTPGRARVACKLLHVAGKSQIPVAVGRKTSDKRDPQFTWAEDFETLKPMATPAANFIIDTAKNNPGEVTLIAVGPLQNVADALRKEPQLTNLLRRVVLMSGCIYGTADRSNTVREWNVLAAKADAQVVYSAGLPLTIVPLDSTTHVLLSDEERERVAHHNAPLSYALECLYRLWLSSPTARMTLHDQLAVAEAARPGAFFRKRPTLALTVDERSYTRIDRRYGKPVCVCLEPNRNSFMRFYLDYLLGSVADKK